MKAICPISGVPFRTYDSLPLTWAADHPIFSIPFEHLVILLEDIRKQEEEQIQSWDAKSLENKKRVSEAAAIKDLTKEANLAIHEHNWKNPAFKLYQTKHLVMLAFMKHAELILCEKGYCARPKPEIVDSHFWSAVELFSWVNTLTNPQLISGIPKYKVSSHNEAMENFPDYLEEINKIKENIGNRYRSASTERKLAAWEQAIAILTRRREVLKTSLSTSTNNLAARWALTITNCPTQYWDFWYAILSSPSTKITFEGVKIGDKWEAVTAGDLREIYDYLDDNLVRPKGEAGEYHRDDSEFYFITRQTVLDTIRRHILILEQGTSSYKIVNAAMGDQVLSASDDQLETKGLAIGLPPKPKFQNHINKVTLLIAIAKWRHATKTAILEKMQVGEAPKAESKEEKGKYDIL